MKRNCFKSSSDGENEVILVRTGSSFHATGDVDAGSNNMGRFPTIGEPSAQSHVVKVAGHINAMGIQTE